MGSNRTALVLGATSGVGGEAAAALLRCGWRVAALVRDPGKEPRRRIGGALVDATWVVGDAANAADVRRAAEGVQAIVHAVNPPSYRRWGELVLPTVDNSIAAAKVNGARIVLPGTIYNYGYDAFPDLDEEAPQDPVTEKGRIRVELERRLEAGSRAGAPALIVRFGDFFGPVHGSTWLSQGPVTPGKRLRAITYPGGRGVGHAWAYLPDTGETIARLLDRSDELDPFAWFHFAGTWDADGTEMTRVIARGVGRPDTNVTALRWLLLGLAGLFQQTPRGVYKMRYLWRTPVRLDNGKLAASLGDEPHTPLAAPCERRWRRWGAAERPHAAGPSPHLVLRDDGRWSSRVLPRTRADCVSV